MRCGPIFAPLSKVNLERFRREPGRSSIYAVTEMVNNAIDHSGGAIVVVALRVSGRKLEVEIRDDGVGIRRMASKFGYADPADAIVDLTKGKRTGSRPTLRRRDLLHFKGCGRS